MFDILSKFGEIKEKASKLKTTIESKSFTLSDEKGLVTVVTNGKKDVLSVSLSPEFNQLTKSEQETVLNDTIKKALSESERFILSELKEIMPNIPGLNIF